MISQQSLPTKQFTSEKAWQTWLAKNHDKSNGVWMMFAKKNADKPTVTYAEALDVALCYGWIDGQKNSYDEQYWIQKNLFHVNQKVFGLKRILNIQND